MRRRWERRCASLARSAIIILWRRDCSGLTDRQTDAKLVVLLLMVELGGEREVDARSDAFLEGGAARGVWRESGRAENQ